MPEKNWLKKKQMFFFWILICPNFPELVHGTIKDFISQLPAEKFERIHKSYVISLSEVVYPEGNRVKIGEHKIPVSINYKEQLIQKSG